ncbi:DAHL domain-containing protein [Roseofilum casamattae]|uniref:histidine kinase n=1 Tax=Roseofilum casamattae BLCC-M143 TaxID=3022442 RepID=A0ABT7BTC3_9CYAN|nr:DAHL domain-containing protein [Roseofilum casamattae]MDJ1182428.1 ATP-binding protein [Roseofilum casamattae BLCC-M143]
MKIKYILFGVIFATASTVLFWLFRQSKAIDFTVNQSYQNALIRQQEQYATFNQDVLRTRYEFLVSYDSLTQQIKMLNFLQQELEEIPDFINSAGQKEIEELLRENQTLLSRHEETIEKFKSQNSLLKNSLRYLPTLVEDISQRLANDTTFEESDRQLLLALDKLLQNLLVYNLSADETREPIVRRNLDNILELNSRVSDREYQKLIQLAVRHGEIILNCKPSLDRLVQSLLINPTDRTSKTLEITYNSYARKAIQKANRYRFYTYSWLLFLVVGLAWSIVHRFQQANRHTINILESITDAFLTIDSQSDITYANPQTAILLNCPLKKLYRHNLLDVFAVPEVLCCPRRRTMICEGTGAVALESYDRNLQRWFEIRVYPQESGFSVFLQDISDRKKAELELQELNHNLEEKVKKRTAQLAESIETAEKARHKAEAANRAKSVFLSNMSHELRTPLNAILGFTQVMERDRNLQGKHREHLKIVSRSGEHLLELINDVLEMSKIEAGRTILNVESFDLYYLLDSLFKLLQLQAEKKGLSFQVERSPDVPQYIKGDRGKLRQILINLLGNGIKFTEEGQVQLSVTSHQSSTQNQQQIAFAVRDTGPGIVAEELENLFQPFVQTETGRNSGEGTGLGLPISRQFVQLMGGDLRVDSQVGRGTQFYFTITVLETKASDIQAEVLEKTAIAFAEGQPLYRAVVADDKWENRLVLRQMLEPFNMEIQDAENGREAIALWETWQPDLIWMDMRMPIMDGYKATQIIRDREALENRNRVAIVAVTASAFESEKVNVLAAGCDDFIRKPFRLEELCDRMTKHLGTKFIYAEHENTTEEETIALNPETFSQLPDLWRQQFYEAASSADDGEMMALIQHLDPAYQNLARSLSELVENFQLDRLLELSQSEVISRS